jgi:hypothetical protein
MNFTEPVPKISNKEALRTEIKKLEQQAFDNVKLLHTKKIDDDEYDRLALEIEERIDLIKEQNPGIDGPDPEPMEKYLGKYEVDQEGYVGIADIAEILGQPIQRVAPTLQQYSSSVFPYLGEMLRTTDEVNFEKYRIHKDDISEFTKRYKEFFGD